MAKQKESLVSASSKKCPKCASSHFRETTLRASDPPLTRTFYQAYRCNGCNYRFFFANRLAVVWAVTIIAVPLSLVMALAFTVPENQLHDAAAYARAVEKAKDGNGAAELHVSRLLSEGDGVLKNEKEAVQWLKKAAEHGNVEAQYLYGDALFKGIGILQNYKDALYWLEKSARAGYVKAQYELGKIYRYKAGIDKNSNRAYLWFTLAAGQGWKEAAAGRDQVEGQLKPEEITALQEEANRIIKGEK
jgi:hypothetical protein